MILSMITATLAGFGLGFIACAVIRDLAGNVCPDCGFPEEEYGGH